MLIPSLDLMAGQAVQLRQGKDMVLSRDNPQTILKDFSRCGETAVIDLDQALGQGHNDALLQELLPLAPCRVGGGVRSVERARTLLSWGARRLIIGTRAFGPQGPDFSFLKDLKEAVGQERIILALDAWQGQLVTHGWTQKTSYKSLDLLQQLAPYAGEFLYTCVEREGTMEGIQREEVETIIRTSPLPVTMAGGISSAEDIATITALGGNVQVGMALYTGEISLSQAFIAGLNWKEELIPTVAQDTRGQVLMLGYSNPASLEQSLKKDLLTFYSRSRQTLWTKGETSGNYLRLHRLQPDCDSDALLATVEPLGPTCHTGSHSCFGTKTFALEDLYGVIEDRLSNPDPTSYTAGLSQEKVKGKVMEEAQEVIEASDNQDIVWEVADLTYHILVLMAQVGIKPSSILKELERRRHL